MKIKRVCPYCNGTGFIDEEENVTNNYPNYPQFKGDKI
jgi:hypothetical protein